MIASKGIKERIIIKDKYKMIETKDNMIEMIVIEEVKMKENLMIDFLNITTSEKDKRINKEIKIMKEKIKILTIKMKDKITKEVIIDKESMKILQMIFNHDKGVLIIIKYKKKKEGILILRKNGVTIILEKDENK